MSTAPDKFSAARQRIAAVYDPLLLEEAGHRLADLLAANLGQVQRSEDPCCLGPIGPRLSRSAPSFAALALPAAGRDATPRPSSREHVLGVSEDSSGRCSTGFEPPRPSLSRPSGSSFGTARRSCSMRSARLPTNVWPSTDGPWATAVEQAMKSGTGEAIGWTPNMPGTVTHGGSLANLTGLLTARSALGDAWEQGLAGSLVASSAGSPAAASSGGLLAAFQGRPAARLLVTPRLTMVSPGRQESWAWERSGNPGRFGRPRAHGSRKADRN